MWFESGVPKKNNKNVTSEAPADSAPSTSAFVAPPIKWAWVCIEDNFEDNTDDNKEDKNPAKKTKRFYADHAKFIKIAAQKFRAKHPAKPEPHQRGN